MKHDACPAFQGVIDFGLLLHGCRWLERPAFAD
jgi:hypothetical protein